MAKSTEEVLNQFEDFNRTRLENTRLRKLIIASIDVEKGYPSILLKNSAKIVRKIFEESELIIEEIEVDKLSLYLGKHISKEEVAQEEFEDILYTKEVKPRKKKITKKIKRNIIKNKAKKIYRVSLKKG